LPRLPPGESDPAFRGGLVTQGFGSPVVGQDGDSPLRRDSHLLRTLRRGQTDRARTRSESTRSASARARRIDSETIRLVSHIDGMAAVPVRWSHVHDARSGSRQGRAARPGVGHRAGDVGHL